jgi:CRISPR-associated protein Cas1
MADIKLNTLYITQEGLYIHHELDLIKVEQKNLTLLKVPIHHLQGIVIMSNSGISPSLIQKCLQKGIYISYLTPRGKFLGRIEGANSGNVLLRKKQFRLTENEKLKIAKTLIAGKLQNQRLNLLRTAREMNDESKEKSLREVASKIEDIIPKLNFVDTIESLRGFEGISAKNYFSVFDHCIINQKEDFSFDKRTKRPPRSKVNALLSFAYSILTNDCISACQSVGLDPFIGIMHEERPGRPSLALDLMEEFRPFAERFILTLINRKQIRKNHIEERTGSVYLLNNEGRKELLTSYQNRKMEPITHHYLEQKTTIGELILLQAKLLARSIREEKENYMPYIWR